MNIIPTLNSVLLTTTPLDTMEDFNIHDMHKCRLFGEKRVVLNRYTILIDGNFTPELVEKILEPISRSPGTSVVNINRPPFKTDYDMNACYELVKRIVDANVAQYNQNIALINRNYDNDENSWQKYGI